VIILNKKRIHQYNYRKSRKLFLVGLKFIPPTWRYASLGFWCIYAPIVAVVCGVLEYDAALIGLFAAVFALVHFLGFRFLLPQQDSIIEAVNKTATEQIGI